MTLVEKERLCQRELDELRSLIDLDVSSYPADVEAALRFVHAHLFEESLNASRVQRQEGLRSHNLAARFKRYLGLGLRDYIEDRRIMAAMRLLWYEEVEIYLVAAAVGYAHHETFTRAFKRRVGCTPSQFRTHFAHAYQPDEPTDPLPPPTEEPPSDPVAPQSREVLMFITDVVGMQTADETHDLRVSGTATGAGEVYVTATAGGESRSQAAEVGPDGRWVALFGGEEDVFACGRPLLVEVGSEGRTQVRWEGPLDCAEVVPRRQRSQKEAIAEEAESGDRAAAQSRGGNYAGDAAMTVTVATGRGPAPPPAKGDDEVEGSPPYYERGRPKRSPRAQPPRVQRTEESAPRRAEPSDSSTPDEADGGLRDEVAALRSQIHALAQALDRESPRTDDEEEEREPVAAEGEPPSAAGAERAADASADAPAADTASDALKAEIAALRRELHEQRTAERATVPVEEADERRTIEADETAPHEEQDGSDEAPDAAWRRAIDELREQVGALRAENEARAEQETEQPAASTTEEADESDDVDEPAWQREIARLREQIEALHASDTSNRAREEGDDTTAATTESSDGDAEEPDRAVSPEDNRADLYEAISALRDRIAQLERADDDGARSERATEGTGKDVEARSPRRGQREAQTDAPREEPPDERGAGVLARQRVEERDVRLGRTPSREREASPGRDEARAPRQGLRHDEAPTIKFEPFEVGEWTDDGQRAVRVRARVTHPSRATVAAELSDDRDDRVLGDGRSERGTLTLDEWVEMEPGTASFTVTVTEPSPARMSTSWTLDEADAREQKQAVVEEGEPDEDDTGWVSRAIGAAWALTVAFFLVSLAAGFHGFLRGVVAAGFLGFFGSYLALTVPRRWGMWTAAGIGLFALSLVTLLPFTPIIQMDGFLLVAALATLGLVGATIVALFVSSD